MAVALARGASGAVLLTLPSPATAVTAQWLDPAGTVVDDELVVTRETWTPAEIAAVVERNVVEVDNSSDIYPDQVVWWNGGTRTKGAPVRVSEVDTGDDVVTLESAPPGAPAIGDTLGPLHASVAIPSSLTATLGLNYRIEWTATLADGSTHQDRVMVHIVATPFHAASSAAVVKRYVDTVFASAEHDAGWYREVARRASERVERKLMASGRLPSLVGDRSLFEDAGHLAMRAELTLEGYIPQGRDPETYHDTLDRALHAAIDEAIASVWVDRDQSGDTTVEGAVKPSGSVGLRRVS